MRPNPQESTAGTILSPAGQAAGLRFGADVVTASSNYAALAQLTSLANRTRRCTLSLALPYGPASYGGFSASGETVGEDEMATLVFVDIPPQTAFALLGALSLTRLPSDVLADCGLSLEELSVREAMADSDPEAARPDR
jgi:hypothetical protein